jgi:hypothetical protein
MMRCRQIHMIEARATCLLDNQVIKNVRTCMPGFGGRGELPGWGKAPADGCLHVAVSLRLYWHPPLAARRECNAKGGEAATLPPLALQVM